jgi:DNA-binding NtrC family response regulator
MALHAVVPRICSMTQGFVERRPRALLNDLLFGAATPKTILIVDDEPSLRTFVSCALQNRGYRAVEADCAERAMDWLMARHLPLALLLSDVGLPGASGADLVRQARLLNPSLPTLLMSKIPRQSLIRDGVIRETTELLQKPFSLEDLFASLESLLPCVTRSGPGE